MESVSEYLLPRNTCPYSDPFDMVDSSYPRGGSADRTRIRFREGGQVMFFGRLLQEELSWLLSIPGQSWTSLEFARPFEENLDKGIYRGLGFVTAWGFAPVAPWRQAIEFRTSPYAVLPVRHFVTSPGKNPTRYSHVITSLYFQNKLIYSSSRTTSQSTTTFSRHTPRLMHLTAVYEYYLRQWGQLPDVLWELVSSYL